MLTLCSASIDWSATGTWVTGLLTVLIAALGLLTWKSQLKLQDRYSKVDGLLDAFVVCIIAGYDWQWNAGIGDERHSNLIATEFFPRWREALMSYRVAWYKSEHFMTKQSQESWLSPDKLQNKIISVGQNLNDYESADFYAHKMSETLKQGLSDIRKIRNA